MNESEKVILKNRRILGFAIIFLQDLKNLELLKFSYLGIISRIASLSFFGIGAKFYPFLGLKCYQGVNVYLTEKRIYAQYILVKKLIFEIPISNIISFREIPLKFGMGVCINYNEEGQEKYVVLILGKKEGRRWIEELNRLIKI